MSQRGKQASHEATAGPGRGPVMQTQLIAPEMKPRIPGVVRVYGEARFHTDGEMLALAFASDGTLWSLDEPGILRQWNRAGQQQAHVFLSDIETLWTFSNNARWLASASDDL